MKIAIATDHAGFEFKEEIKKFLSENAYEVEDFGAFEFNKDDGSVKMVEKMDPDN